MDVLGLIVNWGTILIWAFSLLLWIGRLWRGEATMHPWLKALLSSNVIMGIVICAGLLGTAGMMYLNYVRDYENQLDDVTISAYPPPNTSEQMIVVSNQTFENENIPLDNHVYDHCTFTNVCLVYSGGAYQLQHAVFKEHWKICTGEQSLRNYMTLAFTLHLMRPKVKQTEKSVIKEQATTP